MLRRKRLTFYLLSCIFIFLLFYPNSTSANQLSEIKKSGVLKVGVKQDVPNFGYYNAETNQYEGMEIDIAKKIAKSLGVKPVFVPTTAQTREPLMDNGQIDILIATYTITPERKANYNISKAYYHDEIGFLVRKNSHIKTIKELDGKHIGVAQGATTKVNLEKYAKEHKLKFSYAQLGSFPELAISLYANRIDAFSVDKSILSGYLSPHTTILKEGFNTQEYGIATSKQDKVLIPYVNKLLVSWEKDGSLKHIYQKFKLKPAKVKKRIGRIFYDFIKHQSFCHFKVGRFL